jgi:hypothetical protein
MQGKKSFTPQLFVSDNFYRKLLTELDLHFTYKATPRCAKSGGICGAFHRELFGELEKKLNYEY